MTAWTNTTRCTRCLDVIEPGKIHRCKLDNLQQLEATKPVRAYCECCNKTVSVLTSHHCGPGDDAPSATAPPSDSATLRAMAERWKDKGPAIQVGGGRWVLIPSALKIVADAMEEAE